MFIVSLLEGIGSYLVILAILLEGFLKNPLLKILILMAGLFIIAYSNNNINEDEPEMDVQIETLKNIIVIYATTFLLFFVSLSIFRFQSFYFQIAFSLLIVLLFNVIAIYLRRWFSGIWDTLNFNSSLFVNFNSIYVYLSVFVLFLIIIFFNFPKVSVNQFLNLNNSKSYFSYPRETTDLVNRYKIKTLLDIDMDLDMDLNAYMNQNDDYIFIYVEDILMIYDKEDANLIYSGLYQSQIDGINVILENEEVNELKYQTRCRVNHDCIEYDYPFNYGNVEYKTVDKIFRFDDLSYKKSDTAIFNEGNLHLFKDQRIDSRVLTGKDRPFIGFGQNMALVTDMDNDNGTIVYLQLEEQDGLLNINIKQIIEKDVDLIFPFYGHYRFGMLVFIMFLGFVPVSNYDDTRGKSY